MNHFGDPGYRYHALMTQLWGVLALRLANAEILPFDFEFYGNNIRQFVEDLDLAKPCHRADTSISTRCTSASPNSKLPVANSIAAAAARSPAGA